MSETKEFENGSKDFKDFNYGVLVELTQPFLIIKETLERMGVGSKNKKVISPSAYILKKQDRYYICHFKELLAIDGRKTNYNEEDEKRLNKIVNYLEKWGLIKRLQTKKYSDEDLLEVPLLLVLYKDKPKYRIIHKYKIGKKKY